MEYLFDEIESCECIGSFEDEYVYDIEMNDESHTFIADDILVHNSLYLSYEYLLQSIKGYENMSIEQKRDVIININKLFLNQHNKEFMSEYYETRYGKNNHDFELETIALSGVWLDVKKRYAQILLWKDGDVYDLDRLKMKIKGLEMVKASYPKLSRDILKDMVRFMLENADDKYLVQKMNLRLMDLKKQWDEAPIEDVCENKGVNGYTKYIINDTLQCLVVAPKCPANVRALGNYNRIRQYNHLPGAPIYGGKVKVYQFRSGNDYDYFAFQSMEYPDWAPQYAPIDRNRMFQQFVLDPLNRITSAARLPELHLDGSIQISLF